MPKLFRDLEEGNPRLFEGCECCFQPMSPEELRELPEEFREQGRADDAYPVHSMMMDAATGSKGVVLVAPVLSPLASHLVGAAKDKIMGVAPERSREEQK